MHLLITQIPAADDIATTTHNFLDGTGVLRSLSPTHITQHEIAFTNKIMLLNFVNVAWELLSWLPRTPAAVFLQSLVLRQLERIDDPAHLLETLAGCIGKPRKYTLVSTLVLTAARHSKRSSSSLGNSSRIYW
jgi:nuclear pore complex protein Nup160